MLIWISKIWKVVKYIRSGREHSPWKSAFSSRGSNKNGSGSGSDTDSDSGIEMSSKGSSESGTTKKTKAQKADDWRAHIEKKEKELAKSIAQYDEMLMKFRDSKLKMGVLQLEVFDLQRQFDQLVKKYPAEANGGGGGSSRNSKPSKKSK